MSYNWDITVLEKEGYFYRGPEKSWQLDIYGFYPRGMGDLIYNTLRKIIETNDKSEWAYKAFEACSELLIQGKRWPDYMNQQDVEGKEKFRSQMSMTRDPWIAFYACAIHLDRKQFIELKPQWWLYSPKTWAWRRALLGKCNLYRFWRFFSYTRKEFVKALSVLRWNAYKQLKND